MSVGSLPCCGYLVGVSHFAECRDCMRNNDKTTNPNSAMGEESGKRSGIRIRDQITTKS